MLTNFFKEESGFTLIELMLVIAVLGILAGIAVPRMGGILGRADRADVEAELRQIADALDMYWIDNDREYPDDLTDIEDDLSGGIDLDDYNYDDSPNGDYDYVIGTTDELDDGEYVSIHGNSDGEREIGSDEITE